jgi:hypothetical protein
MTKTKQTKITKTRKGHIRREVGPHHLKPSIYNTFGRIGGQLKLVMWQAFD